MIVFQTLADLAAHQGGEIGVSSWHQIGQDRIDKFAEATGDHQWIHTDPERTRAELGMNTIAHGYLTLSLIPLFAEEVFTVASVKRAINYGINKARFIAMVPSGSFVRGRIGLSRAVASPGSLRAIWDMTVEIRDGERPAMKAEFISLLYE